MLYDAVPVTALPENALAALQDGTLDGVLLFSPRSAKTFATLVTEAKLAAACEELEAYCISAATAVGADAADLCARRGGGRAQSGRDARAHSAARAGTVAWRRTSLPPRTSLL